MEMKDLSKMADEINAVDQALQEQSLFHTFEEDGLAEKEIVLLDEALDIVNGRTAHSEQEAVQRLQEIRCGLSKLLERFYSPEE